MGYLRGTLIILISLTIFCSAMPLHAADSRNTGQESAKSGDSKRYITIDFDNVDIRLFIKYISELTGKNFVIDKAVQGNVTILSPTRISEADAYKVFESVLEVHGFTTVRSGSVTKILPSAAARSKNVETIRTGRITEPEDKIVTQLVPLQYSSPDEMKKVLTPLVSKTSVLISHPQSGMLILTETLSNIQRLMSIIEVLDVEYSDDEVAVISLHNAAASTISKILTTVYQRSSRVKKGAVQVQNVKVVPYDRVNALVVMAEKSELSRIRRLVKILDTPVQRGEGNIHVFYLQNAYAAELAKVLTALPTSQNQAADKGKAPAISKDVKITADEETNSLIITASREEYMVLEEVIKKLDIPRQMVYLEALILEVNTDKDFDVGVNWSWNDTVSDGDVGIFSGFNDGSDTFNRSSSTDSSSVSLSNGFSVGVLKQGIQIGDVIFPDIGAVLNAYESDSDINIISTPQILTTDNKKAEISVGENVPYITSQNTTEGQQDYTQYEYRDVATKMTITPHINQADTMRLEIETEIVKLKADSVELTPTTFRRTASTNVIVSDKDTVVIGGIIGEDSTRGEAKIPILGDIPGLGWLFKSRSTTSVKTNMFIFITPKIIRNPANIAGVTLEKEDSISTVMPKAKDLINKPINKKHAIILTERGFTRLLAKKNVEAKQYFKEALYYDSKNPYALLNMGVVHERDGKYQVAIDYYQQVIITGTDAKAGEATDSSKQGLSLTEIAHENIERLRNHKMKQK